MLFQQLLAELYEADQRDSQGASWTYMPYGPFETLEEYRAWMEATCSDSDPLFHAIVDTETERAVGVASYLRIRPAGGSLEVGHIHYSPALSRTAQGIARADVVFTTFRQGNSINTIWPSRVGNEIRLHGHH